MEKVEAINVLDLFPFVYYPCKSEKGDCFLRNCRPFDLVTTVMPTRPQTIAQPTLWRLFELPRNAFLRLLSKLR